MSDMPEALYKAAKRIEDLEAKLQRRDEMLALCEARLGNIAHIGVVADQETGQEYDFNPIEEARLGLSELKEMRGALNEVRKESLIQVPCPDGVAGCAVLHRKLDKRGKLASEALTKCEQILGEKCTD